MIKTITAILLVLLLVNPILTKGKEINDMGIDELLPILEGGADHPSSKAINRARELKDPKAIPALEKIMRDHFEKQDELLFTAAQTLFCIGTEDAHRILRKSLLDKKYHVRESIIYSFNRGMEKTLRNEFIKKYHLNNTSDDLSIKITSAEMSGEILFNVTLKNISKKPLILYRPWVYIGEYLLIEDPDGDFKKPLPAIVDIFGPHSEKANYFEIFPQDELKFEMKAALINNNTFLEDVVLFIKKILFIENKNEFFMLSGGDVTYYLYKSGKYNIYAIYDMDGNYPPETKNIWSGRVVSAPIQVKLKR
jgi:hypothetical protein